MTTWNEMVVIGRIARPHGRRGEVIVNLETDFPECRFGLGSVIYATMEDEVRALRIVDVRFQSGRPILALDGISTIEKAKALAGVELRVPVSEQQPLPPDTFYKHALVGCEVRTVGDALVGKVIEVQGVPGASRLVVHSSDTGDEVDIPLAEPICVRVDPDSKVVVVDPPAGLLELNRRVG